MSKRFGKARVADCQCEHNFTCRPCLVAAAWRVIRFGVHQEVSPT